MGKGFDINQFENSLLKDVNLASWTDPKSIVRDVINATLKSGNIKLERPELLVEAAIRNPDVIRDIKAVAGRMINELQ